MLPCILYAHISQILYQYFKLIAKSLAKYMNILAKPKKLEEVVRLRSACKKSLWTDGKPKPSLQK